MPKISLKPNDYIITFLSEYNAEKAAKVEAQPRYAVVEVTQMSTTYCIASWNIGVKWNHKGQDGWLRPYWCLEVGGFLDIGKPNYISALTPHWLFAETLTTDLVFDDDTLIDTDVDVCYPFWVVTDDDNDYKNYTKSLDRKLVNRHHLFATSYNQALKHIEEIIIEAWTQYWASSVYSFKAHNWLNHTLNKKIKRVNKTTLGKGVVYCSYEFVDGKRGSTILSRRGLDDMSTADERWVSYAPKFDADNSPEGVLLIKGWEIYAEIEENGKSKLRTVSSVINIGGLFYRVDRKIVDHEGDPFVELPGDYVYAPEKSIYDAIFHSKKVGDNATISSNFFVDPLAREFAKKAKGFGMFVEQQKKKSSAPTWNQFMIDTSLNDELDDDMDSEL